MLSASLDRDGWNLILAVRDAKNGTSATLTLHRGAAATIYAWLAAAGGEDGDAQTFAADLRGELEIHQ
jgi:hypothetical protein